MAEFPQKAKVVIIGLGGIVGASIAHHLIERGWDDIVGIDKSGIPTDQRLRLYALIRDLTASEFGGYNYIVTLHGEGPLTAQALALYREYDLERCKDLVLKAMDRAAAPAPVRS